jgi:hypothetical protein
LWHDFLREEGFVPVVDGQGAYHLDIIGSGCEEDTLTYLKYYADEKERKDWAQECPDWEIPEVAQVPYDRDRHLPQWEPTQQELAALQD